MNKMSLILEIQDMASNEDISIGTILRKCKILASKLELDDFLEWIDNELNGYANVEREMVPNYRKCSADAQAFNPYHGWQSIIFENPDVLAIVSTTYVMQDIGSIEVTLNRGKNKEDPKSEFVLMSPEQKQVLMKAINYQGDVKLVVPYGSIWGVLEAVRNSILDWALKLEKVGIAGDNLSFSLQEKKDAQPVTQQIFAQNINHVGDVLDHASVHNNQTASIQLQKQDIQELIKKIEPAISILPEEIRNPVKSYIEELENIKNKDEIDQEEAHSTLNSIKDICTGATGNLAAEGILSLIRVFTG